RRRGGQAGALAALLVEEPGEGAQHGRLPAAAGTGQQHPLTGRDLQIEPRDGGLGPGEGSPGQTGQVQAGRGGTARREDRGPPGEAAATRECARPGARESTAPVETSARVAAQPSTPHSRAPESRKNPSITPE